MSQSSGRFVLFAVFVLALSMPGAVSLAQTGDQPAASSASDAEQRLKWLKAHTPAKPATPKTTAPPKVGFRSNPKIVGPREVQSEEAHLPPSRPPQPTPAAETHSAESLPPKPAPAESIPSKSRSAEYHPAKSTSAPLAQTTPAPNATPAAIAKLTTPAPATESAATKKHPAESHLAQATPAPSSKTAPETESSSSKKRSTEDRLANTTPRPPAKSTPAPVAQTTPAPVAKPTPTVVAKLTTPAPANDSAATRKRAAEGRLAKATPAPSSTPAPIAQAPPAPAARATPAPIAKLSTPAPAREQTSTKAPATPSPKLALTPAIASIPSTTLAPAKLQVPAPGASTRLASTKTQLPDNNVSTARGRYPWKTGIVTTVFWIGEPSGGNNSTPNHSSSWDAHWTQSYGGFDTPDPNARRNFIPARFTPRQNPFYVALPYNDVTRGNFKPEARRVIPWYREAFHGEGQSVCRDRWVAIRSRSGRVVYAQWSDCGPFRTDHWEYVFGNDRPKPNLNRGAGLDVSPAVRDYLGIDSTDVTDWKFVDFKEVPSGPWAHYGDNNTFVMREARGTKNAANAGPRKPDYSGRLRVREL